MLAWASDGSVVDDGLDARSAPLGAYAFVERLDAEGQRIEADFLDVPFPANGAMAAQAAGGTVAMLSWSPQLFIGVGVPIGLAWSKDAPEEIRAGALAADPTTDVVTMFGTLPDGEAVTIEGVPGPIGGDPGQFGPLLLWAFDPLR